MKPVRSLLMVLSLAAVAGCAGREELVSPTRHCTTEGSSWAIGKPADVANGQRLFRESGAGLWRIIMPIQAVPSDRRDDRLTVHVDNNNVITAVTCE